MAAFMAAFMAASRKLITFFTMLRNGLYGGSFSKSELGPGMDRIVVDWCAVINEKHMVMWVAI